MSRVTRSRRPLLAGGLTLAAIFLALALAASAASADPIGEVSEFPTGFQPGTTANGSEGTIVVGPEANIWFTAGPDSEATFGQIDPSTGDFAETPDNLNPQYSLASTAGDLWFSSNASFGILGEYDPHTKHGGGHYIGYEPESVTLGHDGDLWFTDAYQPTNESVGRVTPSPFAVSDFPLPPGDAIVASAPIAPGPEGDVWVALSHASNSSDGGLAQITPTGDITVPWYGFASDQAPSSLAQGPSQTEFGSHETLWFTQPGSDQIGVYIAGLGVSEFSLGTTANNQPEQIVEGSEGDMWFTQPGSDQIGRIDPMTGEVFEFSTGSGPADAPGAIVLGPEENLWFTQGGDQIGRMGTEGQPATSPPLIETNPSSVTVAEGENATFSSTASGGPEPTVTWEVSSDAGNSWSQVPGASSPTLTLSAVTSTQSENEYRAVWQNTAGSETSAPATLTVSGVPTVVAGPVSSLTATSATLNDTIDPNGFAIEECAVVYKTSSSAGEAQCNSLPSGLTGAQPVYQDISALQPNTTYEYHFRAENQDGVGESASESFTTLATSASGSSTSPSGTAYAAIGRTLEGEASEGEGALTVGAYGSNPVGSPPFMSAGKYFDAYLSAGSTFTSLELIDCELGGGSSLYWWNPQANGGNGAWQAVSDETAPTGNPPCITATINSTTSPDLAQMTGTVFGVSLPLGPAPTVKKLSAKKGTTAGGTKVTIAGTGFAGVSAVKFGATEATDVTFNSATSITVTTPAETAGTVSVTVTTPNGTSSPNAKARFRFKAPKVKH